MDNLMIFLNEELEQLGTKKFKQTDDVVQFKKATCKVRLDAYLFKNDKTIFYAYIYPTDERLLIDNGKSIELEPIKKGNVNSELVNARLKKIKEDIDKHDLDALVSQKVIGQLANLIVNGVKNNWILIILALGSGVAVGYILGANIGHQATKTIIEYANSTVTNSTATPTFTPIP